MTSHKRIAILGSTGSIGTQTLDIVEHNPSQLSVSTLIAGRNADLLIEQCRRFKPARAIIADPELYPALARAVRPLGVEPQAGSQAIIDAMDADDTDMVITATVGYSGLLPTIRAIEAGKQIGLANKETLVVAGELINRMLPLSQSRIYPVDSEHSAIYQCLQGEDTQSIDRLIITASGGPFRTFSPQDIAKATAAQALKHPNWEMGAKITIDSATMINKAFEIIEAHWLFGISPERIEAVVHPQSIVHSMVQFTDGAIKAQLGKPDMRIPISYALGCATRSAGASAPLSLADYARLTFEAPDTDRFPCLTLAYTALQQGGNTACIINAANEVANEAFRKGLIGFNDIYRIIQATLLDIPHISSPTLDDYIQTNTHARQTAASLI